MVEKVDCDSESASTDNPKIVDVQKSKAKTSSSEHGEEFIDIGNSRETSVENTFGIDTRGSSVLEKNIIEKLCIQAYNSVPAASPKEPKIDSVSPNAWKEPINNEIKVYIEDDDDNISNVKPKDGDWSEVSGEPCLPTNLIVANSLVEKPSQDSSCLKGNTGEASSPQGPLKALETSPMAIKEPKGSKKCLKVPDIGLQNEMATSKSNNTKHPLGPTPEDSLPWKSLDKDDRQPVKENEAKKFTMLQRAVDSQRIMSIFNRGLRNISLKGLGLARRDRVGNPEQIGRGGLGSRDFWDNRNRRSERSQRSIASSGGFLELSVGESIDYTFPHPLNNARNGNLCEFKIFRGTTDPDNICYYSLRKKNYHCLLGGVDFKRANNEITVSFQNVTSTDTSLYIIHRSDICGGDITFQMKVSEATTTTKTASTATPSSAAGVHGNLKIWAAAAFIILIIWLQHDC